ncbi:MAG: hypothetical protein KatS3mg090_0714 [Patescibacteria group bacterium]|nr:MAG: hypothetical protein KatS3mg090_0714 [Patescibacteria group bacterium]
MFKLNPNATKKYLLTSLLSLISFVEGVILANLNLYPLSRTLIINNGWLILASLFFWIIFMIFVLILDFGLKRNKRIAFTLASTSFSLPFLIKTKSIFLISGLFLIFYYLLNTLNKQLKKKSDNYVKINIIEILSPLLKLSFNILLALITIIVFYQTNQYTTEKNLVTEDSLKTILEPVKPIVNQQFNQLLEKTIEKDLEQKLSIEDKKTAAKILLDETIETLLEGEIRQSFGTNKLTVPLEKITIDENGDIDIYPAIEYLIPKIIERINNLSLEYRLIISAITSFIIYLAVSIITRLFYFISLPIIFLVFKLLMKLNVIKIKLIKVDKQIISI